MAFFLSPRFAPAFQHCGPYGAPSRPRHVARSSAPSFIPFLGQLDGLISELDREARHAAYKQRQQRKRQFRARFDVKEHKERYEIEGDVPGFEQENISIEVTDEHTLKVSGDTEQRIEQPVTEQPTTDAQTEQMEQMAGLTLNELEASQDEKHADSDTESRTSYQATVEDDFEDLGAEAVSPSSTPAEPKGKEKAVEATTETTVQKQAQPEVPAPQQQEPEFREWLSERVHGSFERTFQFPERIDMAHVKATLKNGVLSLTVPKAPAFEPKRITIQ